MDQNNCIDNYIILAEKTIKLLPIINFNFLHQNIFKHNDFSTYNK